MTVKSFVFIALGAAVLGTGAFGLHLQTNGHRLATIKAERTALEKCLPGSKEMNIPDNVVQANILLYKKTIEIVNSIKDENEREDKIKEWGAKEYIKYINSFPKEKQKIIFKLLKILRVNDEAGSCLIGEVPTLGR